MLQELLKIIVCVKRIRDINLPGDPFFIINPYDLEALIMALKIKKTNGAKVTVLSIGEEDTEDCLRYCLLLGADRAIRIWRHGFKGIDAQAKALVLAEALGRLSFDIVLLGSKSLDEGAEQIGAAVAEFLDLPFIERVVDFFILEGQVKAQKRLEKGEREVVVSSLPLVLSIESQIRGVIEPSLPELMEALRKEVEVWDNVRFPISPTRMKGPFFPKPFPKEIFTPESSLPAHLRIELILSAGLKERKTKLVDGRPEEVAKEIYNFLRQKGFISGK